MNQFRKTVVDNRGFTMIEVVAILVVLGIVTAVAISRGGPTRQDLVSEADIVKTHLRFAQLKALQDDTAVWPLNWGIAFAGSSYTLYYNGAPAATVKLPGEGSNTHSFSSGVTSTNTTVNFDSWGSPGGAATIVLSQSGTTSTISVSDITGYITP